MAIRNRPQRHTSATRLHIEDKHTRNTRPGWLDVPPIKDRIAHTHQVEELQSSTHSFFSYVMNLDTSPLTVSLPFKDWNKVITNFEALSLMERLWVLSTSYQKVKLWLKSQEGNTPEVSTGSSAKPQGSSPVPRSEN